VGRIVVSSAISSAWPRPEAWAVFVTGTRNTCRRRGRIRSGVEQPTATDDADDGGIPSCLRRCEQCGEPSDADKGAVTPRDFGGIQHWLHERCDFEF
jgi:hypothetical protein